MVHRKKDLAPVCATSSLPASNNDVAVETGAAPLMDWDDVKELFTKKLTTGAMENAFRLLESPLPPDEKRPLS